MKRMERNTREESVRGPDEGLFQPRGHSIHHPILPLPVIRLERLALAKDIDKTNIFVNNHSRRSWG